jgi:hypothetical protein
MTDVLLALGLLAFGVAQVLIYRMVRRQQRTIDKVAEDLAREILQDREFRARVEALMKQERAR